MTVALINGQFSLGKHIERDRKLLGDKITNHKANY